MKKLIRSIVLMLAPSLLFAQVPQLINYQGMARTANGQPLINKSISIRLSIINDSPSGVVEYSETQTTTTNGIGLFNVAIGAGTPIVGGSLASVNWSIQPKFIKSEFDPLGGTNYILAGTSQIMSAPYAMYAGAINQKALPTMNLTQKFKLIDEIGNNLTDNSGVTITLTGTNPKMVSTSNTQGIVNLINVPTGTYNLEYSKPSYDPGTILGVNLVAGGLTTLNLTDVQLIQPAQGPLVINNIGFSLLKIDYNYSNPNSSVQQYTYSNYYPIITVSGTLPNVSNDSKHIQFYMSTSSGNYLSGQERINLSASKTATGSNFRYAAYPNITFMPISTNRNYYLTLVPATGYTGENPVLYQERTISAQNLFPTGVVYIPNQNIYTSILTDPAHCGALNNPCGSFQYCNNGVCMNYPGSCSANSDCPAGQLCSGGNCVCPQGTTKCGNNCVTLNTDVNNCGNCGTVCPVGQTCLNGMCISCNPMVPCPPGKTCVNGVCQ